MGTENVLMARRYVCKLRITDEQSRTNSGNGEDLKGQMLPMKPGRIPKIHRVEMT